MSPFFCVPFFRDNTDSQPSCLHRNHNKQRNEKQTTQLQQRSLMPEPFIHTRRVEFRDTDMAGIVHFSNFFAYMEQAEHALLRSVGLGVIDCEIDGVKISFPRVGANCNYRNAIRFEEMIDVHVYLDRVGTKSLTYGFEFYRDDEIVADGSVTVVCCLLKHGEGLNSIPTPQKFIDAIARFRRDENDGQDRQAKSS